MKNLLLILLLFIGFLVQAQTDSVQVVQPMEKDDLVGDKIYEKAEQMPEFPGGEEAMLKFISQNLQYPENAIVNEVEGVVLIKFVVNAKGAIRNIEVISKVRHGFGLEEEAQRVIRKMPLWSPGKSKGKPVSVLFILPISFRIN